MNSARASAPVECNHHSDDHQNSAGDIGIGRIAIHGIYPGSEGHMNVHAQLRGNDVKQKPQSKNRKRPQHNTDSIIRLGLPNGCGNKYRYQEITARAGKPSPETGRPPARAAGARHPRRNSVCASPHRGISRTAPPSPPSAPPPPPPYPPTPPPPI